jgi:putative phosphoesterase
VLIAAISDTHIPDKARALPEVLAEQLRRVDLILHAGDLSTAAALDYISTLGPTEAVYGNVDEAYLKTTLPRTRVISAGGFRIGLVHGDGSGGSTAGRAYRAFADVDCIVFGHSHSPSVERLGSVLMVNPGSPTDKRRAPRPSFALIKVGDQLLAEIVYL